MKKIELVEQKKILVEILKYIDDICKKNDIKYSLICGSLIGAIRHKGIIPWDDDIDIALLPEEYDKLMNALSKKNDRYILLDPERNPKYYYPFAKLVDSRTTMFEKGIKTIDNYGVYVDIFRYDYVSNNKLIRKLHYKYLIFIQTLFSRAMLDPKNIKRLKSKLIVIFARIIGVNYFRKKHMRLCRSKKKTDYVLINWPEYGFNKEIMKTVDFQKYQKVKFENIEAMILTDYDEVLRTMYGDYMQLPPEKDRVARHVTEIYWRD